MGVEVTYAAGGRRRGARNRAVLLEKYVLSGEPPCTVSITLLEPHPRFLGTFYEELGIFFTILTALIIRAHMLSSRYVNMQQQLQ